jgi:hypothetical protein
MFWSKSDVYRSIKSDIRITELYLATTHLQYHKRFLYFIAGSICITAILPWYLSPPLIQNPDYYSFLFMMCSSSFSETCMLYDAIYDEENCDSSSSRLCDEAEKYRLAGIIVRDM